MLKSYRVGGVVAHDFSVSPRPLGFGFLGFWAKGLGPGLDNKKELDLNEVSLVSLFTDTDMFSAAMMASGLQLLFLATLRLSQEK